MPIKLNRCPVCHSSISLDAMVQDEAGRELLGILSKLDTQQATALLGYLGLFRAQSRDLDSAKALKLAKETLQLTEMPTLIHAMSATVECIYNKRSTGQPTTTFKDHSYLKKVIKDTNLPETDNVSPGTQQKQSGGYGGKKSKSAIAIEELDLFGKQTDNQWLRLEIAEGLKVLVSLGLEGVPAADSIHKTAASWLSSMLSQSIVWDEELDKIRIKQAFKQIANNVTRWPAPKQFKDFLLPRRQQPKNSTSRSPERHINNVADLKNALLPGK